MNIVNTGQFASIFNINIPHIDCYDFSFGNCIIWTCIPIVFFVVFKESQKKTFITISSEGLTFCGTVDPWRNYKKDFSIVHHFRWEEIRQLSFTRIATAPAYLFIDPNEGETKCIFIYRGWNLIDKLRKFTGFHGCRELGNHFQYIKQEDFLKKA